MYKRTFSPFLRCPCEAKSELNFNAEASYFICEKCGENFTTYRNKPVLVSFDKCDTICNADLYKNAAGEGRNDIYIKRRRSSLLKNIQKLFLFTKITKRNCSTFLNYFKKIDHPLVLVIGSGTKGDGAELLWASDIERVGIDVYASDSVDYIVDAHYLPFQDAAFDGVWIQAVLEHVVEPEKVVDEIYRVLKMGGVVYSETPFMQQVHEGPFDFKRFSLLGHRYLFKKFDLHDMGVVNGPGIALSWAIKYFLWALFRNRFLATVLTFPIRGALGFLDKLIDPKVSSDSASGVYFLGVKKSGIAIRHEELIECYRGSQGL
jgi:SAM-dependent methyltransferase